MKLIFVFGIVWPRIFFLHLYSIYKGAGKSRCLWLNYSNLCVVFVCFYRCSIFLGTIVMFFLMFIVSLIHLAVIQQLTIFDLMRYIPID
jgi:hypothetical protein